MLVISLYAAPLAVAAAWDVATFRIPNFLNLIFLALFPVAALLAPQPLDWPWHLAAGGLVLAVGFVMFALNLFGGGDVKMLAVAALWMGWDNLLGYVLWVGLIGGVLAVLLLVLRSDAAGMVLSHLGRMPKVLQKKAPVPYGIAIALGGLAMAGELPMLAG